MKDFQQIENLIPSIDERVNYWMVRTDGGSLYDPFVKRGVIAFGYPKIELNSLERAKQRRQPLEYLKKVIERLYPDQLRPGLPASQLWKFAYGIKKGDYVLIPSASSTVLTIGQVQDDHAFHDIDYTDDRRIPGFNKLRKVGWRVTTSKDKVNMNLLGLLSNHQAITDAGAYAKWIDSLLFDFYRKGDKYHLILDVRRDQALNARQLFKSCLDLLDSTDSFCRYSDIPQSIDDATAKLNLNSPGFIEFVSKAGIALFAFGLILIGSVGGNFQFKLEKIGLDAQIQTDGIISKVNQFLNDQEHREFQASLREKLTALDIKDPNVIIKIMHELNEEE